MKEIVEFPLEDGGTVQVEVSAGSGVYDVGPGDVVTRARETLDSALAHLRPVCTSVIRSVRDAAVPPDRVCVEFGVKLTAKAGLVVASGTSEANLKVQLEWTRLDGPVA